MKVMCLGKPVHNNIIYYVLKLFGCHISKTALTRQIFLAI